MKFLIYFQRQKSENGRFVQSSFTDEFSKNTDEFSKKYKEYKPDFVYMKTQIYTIRLTLNPRGYNNCTLAKAKELISEISEEPIVTNGDYSFFRLDAIAKREPILQLLTFDSNKLYFSCSDKEVQKIFNDVELLECSTKKKILICQKELIDGGFADYASYK
jgi:hypothetical protein